MRIAAIVPSHNEARNLPRLAEAFRARAPGSAPIDVCVVDDGSSDDTARVGASFGWSVLRLPVNLGIGGAVQAGYLWACERGYDVAVQIDGDGQHDPAFLRALLAPIEAGAADVVIGSRFLSEGGYRSTTVRRLGIAYLSWYLRLRCGARVTDPTSGFRAASRDAIELFARYYPSDYPEPEAIALARRAGLRVTEVPVRMHDRTYGRSSIDLWRTLYYLVKVSLALVLLPPRTAPRPAGAPEGAP
jgi:glycosyltransferase involved in cell wall biosynthesis